MCVNPKGQYVILYGIGMVDLPFPLVVRVKGRKWNVIGGCLSLLFTYPVCSVHVCVFSFWNVLLLLLSIFYISLILKWFFFYIYLFYPFPPFLWFSLWTNLVATCKGTHDTKCIVIIQPLNIWMALIITLLFFFIENLIN